MSQLYGGPRGVSVVTPDTGEAVCAGTLVMPVGRKEVVFEIDVMSI